MIQQPYVIPIMVFAMINGIFSPILLGVFFLARHFMPAFFVADDRIALAISSILLATMTIIVAGIPAALYERWSGAKESTGLSMWIWMAGTGLLTLPAAGNFFKFGL